MEHSYDLLNRLAAGIDSEATLVRTSRDYTPFVIELEELGYTVEDVLLWVSALTDEWGDDEEDFDPEGEFVAIIEDLCTGPGVFFYDEWGRLDTIVLLGDLLESEMHQFHGTDGRYETQEGRGPANPQDNYSSRMKAKNFSAYEYFKEDPDEEDTE